MWYNNTLLLAQNRFVTPGHPRVHVNNDHQLEISNVLASDSSRYSCNLLPENITENVFLHVETPPSADIYTADNRLVTGRSLTFRQGESVDVLCKARGYPEPSIQWSAAGHRILADTHYHLEGGHLQIANPGHEHVHIYQCLADNGVGLDHVSVTINIMCKYIHISNMLKSEIICNWSILIWYIRHTTRHSPSESEHTRKWQCRIALRLQIIHGCNRYLDT